MPESTRLVQSFQNRDQFWLKLGQVFKKNYRRLYLFSMTILRKYICLYRLSMNNLTTFIILFAPIVPF